MHPDKQLIDELRRSKIDAARRMTPEQKLRAGPELYDMTRELARAGLRARHPEADEQELERLVQARLNRARVGAAGA
jgi:hypothetical protein